jgi:hypothetical protein
MTEADDPSELMGANWSLDGPYSPERLCAALSMASALVRYTNHATFLRPAAMWGAPEMYPVLGNLSEAVGRLEQLTQQLASWCRALADDPTLRHDGYRTYPIKARRAAAAAAEFLVSASAIACQLAEAVASAHQQISHLYHQEDA